MTTVSVHSAKLRSACRAWAQRSKTTPSSSQTPIVSTNRAAPQGCRNTRRARDRADARSEVLEVAVPAQAVVDVEPDKPEDEQAADDGAGGDAGGRLARQGDAEHEEEDDERGGVEDALGHDRPENLAALGVRAVAEQEDAQHLAAASGQHRVAHVADGRDGHGVLELVLDLGVAQDHVPAPAADERGHGVDGDCGENEQQAGGALRKVRRLLLRGPPHAAAERHHRDGDREDRTAVLGELAMPQHGGSV